MLLFISFLFGTILFYLFNYFPFSSIALFISASAYMILKRKALLIPVIVIGIVYAFFRFSPGNDLVDIYDKELRVTGRFRPKISAITSGNSIADRSIQAFTIDTAFDPESGEEIGELHNKEVNVISDFAADYDGKYELLLKTGKNRTRLNPGRIKGGRLYGSLIAVSKRQEAPDSILDEFSEYRLALNNFVLGRFNKDSAGLISAITTGERAYLSEDVRDAFNTAGLAHILSISGTHFGLFSVIIFGFFIFLIKRLPYKILQRLTIYLTPSQSAAILCIPFMLMYLGISGGSVPAIRSFLMITLFLAGLLLGRKGFWLNSLMFAAFILVIWDPAVILSLSFHLSFIAVLFIGFTLEKRKDEPGIPVHDPEPSGSFPQEDGNRLVRYIKKAVMLTIAASIGTSPLAAYHFHYFSVISPVSNLLIAPLIGFILIPLSLISSFSFLATGQYIFGPFVAVSADLSIALVKLMSKIPFADLKIPAFPLSLCIFFYLCFLLYIVLGRRKKLLIIPFIPFLIYAVFNAFERKDLSVTFLDVGQGDSAVIELPDKKVIVIDTGWTGKETTAFLRYAGKKDIDALLLSHIDSDHSGGFKYITKRFNVKEIWDNGRIKYPESMNINAEHRIQNTEYRIQTDERRTKGPVPDGTGWGERRRAKGRALERGDIIEEDSYRITILHPYREFYTLFGEEREEVNNSSVVLKLSGRRSSFLFTGDIGEEAEADISYLQKWLSSDVIKIPHHGSRTSSSDEFLSAVSPSIAVISVGRNNSFGHPSSEVLEKLSGIKIFRTDRHGATKIIETENGLVTKTYKEFMLEKADGLSTEINNIRRLFSTW